MFDGKSLAGWHSFRRPDISGNGWIVKDSSIYLRGLSAGALLAPEAFVYRNFEISVDWKIADSGNSGIFLRYLETEASENIRTGPESQVCGKLRLDYKNGMEVTSPGACYAMYAPAKPWIKSADQYNTFHVIMYENRVAHFGNGTRLLEYVIGSDDWKTKYDKSKYSTFPLYGDIHAGKLFLQDHASPVWYRNLKIRPLTEDPWVNKDFIWPDQTSRIAHAPVEMAGAPLLSLRQTGSGRVELRFTQPGEWRLELDDARGGRLQTMQGSGPGTRSLGPLPGWGGYFLSGSIGGHPYSRHLSAALP